MLHRSCGIPAAGIIDVAGWPRLPLGAAAAGGADKDEGGDGVTGAAAGVTAACAKVAAPSSESPNLAKCGQLLSQPTQICRPSFP